MGAAPPGAKRRHPRPSRSPTASARSPAFNHAVDEVLVPALRRAGFAPAPDNIVRVQDVGLRTKQDPIVLAWAAKEERLVLSHDARTMPQHAESRVRVGQRMPGLVLISRAVSVGVAIQELAILATCSEPAEWEGLVIRLPL